MVGRTLRLATAVTVGLLLFSACGGGNNVTTSPTTQTSEPGGGTESCEGTALPSSDLKLPSDFPIPGEAVLTRSSEAGPSQVIEGFYEADLESAYNEWKEALENAEYTILFDEIEDKDSEISYKSKDETSTGQIALRSECGRNDRTFVHITNRPA
jgi:hypothetical protein